jgi:hypothetical protein
MYVCMYLTRYLCTLLEGSKPHALLQVNLEDVGTDHIPAWIRVAWLISDNMIKDRQPGLYSPLFQRRTNGHTTRRDFKTTSALQLLFPFPTFNSEKGSFDTPNYTTYRTPSDNRKSVPPHNLPYSTEPISIVLRATCRYLLTDGDIRLS